MTVMRSYHATPGAGIAGLRVEEHSIPEPRPMEVLVRVHAVALNYRELLVLRDAYPLPLKPDLIPVSDGAGEVVAVGSGVTRVSVGERVAAAIFPRWLAGPFTMDVADQLGGSRDGMLTEYAALPEEALVRVPDPLSYAEAATLPCAAVTAWHALTGGRGLRPGETVLTLGSGGVSLFALQFAQLFGARVIATTGSADKVKRLRALGAAHVLDYRRTPAWSEQVRELTDGAGADLVVEVAGTLEQSLAAVARDGEIAFVGLLDKQPAAVEQRALWLSGATVRPVAVGSRAHFTEMLRAIGAHRLTPVIDRVFPFAEAPAAYRYFETARPFGKVVIADA
jgi:NADPH:quinone reductase-like Zn-dependent oxidoreductase